MATKYSASELSQDAHIDDFRAWSSAVRLRTTTLINTPERPLPIPLSEIIAESRKFPTWTTNPDDQFPYSTCHTRLHPQINALRAGLAATDTLTDTDTNSTLHESLSSYLAACRSITRSTSGGGGKHNGELPLMPPCVTDYGVHPETTANGLTSFKPDSIACIPAGGAALDTIPEIKADFTCIASHRNRSMLSLPHWLSEFKSQTTAGSVALRQLQIAMVSALYQRRALNHPEHYVFGMWHVTEDALQVIAGTWVSSSTLPLIDERPSDATDPRTSSRASSSRSRRGVNVPLRGATSQARLRLLPGDDMEIVTYHIRQFEVSKPSDFLRLHLTILATLPLAIRYRDQIRDDPPLQPANLMESWPDNLSRRSSSRTSTSRTGNSSIGRQEALEEKTSGDDPLASNCEAENTNHDSDDANVTTKLTRRAINYIPECAPYYKCLHYVGSTHA